MAKELVLHADINNIDEVIEEVFLMGRNSVIEELRCFLDERQKVRVSAEGVDEDEINKVQIIARRRD